MTQDIQFQIECLATELTEMLMAEYDWDIRHALDELYSSTTFAKLNDPECGLYYRAPSIYSNSSNPKSKSAKRINLSMFLKSQKLSVLYRNEQ